MTNKHLILLSDNYPNSNGEFFLDDEIQLIAPKFETITVLCKSPKKGKTRQTPENVHVLGMPQMRSKQRFLFRIKGLFFMPLWQEIYTLKKHYGIRVNFLIFKILLEDYVRASHVINELNKHKLINSNEHILYSYWHDYKALAIARIRKKSGCMAIARCHRWDVYFYANTPSYLPFRQFILNELALTCSISEDGINYINQMHKSSASNKVVLSRLGKTNTRVPKLEKGNLNNFIICSCSTLTKVKRVDLIIAFMCQISKHIEIQWFHFGDGALKEVLLALAAEQLKGIHFEFMGIKPNHEILDFYNNNYVDLFINFSESEGIPVSIMEAQSAGIPVLATAVGGTPEIVNKENGFLVDQDVDMAETVELILAFLHDTPENIKIKREAAYQNWNKYYNAEKNYAEFADVLLGINESVSPWNKEQNNRNLKS